MKRQTALKNANEIARRIRAVNGLVGTPYACHEAFKIRRVWLFGSVAKGGENPNDVDILVDGESVGRWQMTGKHKPKGDKKTKCNAKIDKRYYKSTGIACSVSSEYEAYKYLKRNLKKISIHEFRIDGKYNDIPHTKIMIYPINKLPSK